MDEKTLTAALGTLGHDYHLRHRVLDLCREIERDFDYPGSIRDEITGPIIDAAHANAGILRKVLSNGLRYDFRYRSKIARELVMSPDEVPDHVWEPQTTRLLVHLGENAPHVVIGGAYAGDQAIILAAAMARRSGGLIHAFEPNRDQREMLVRNAHNNELTNILAQSLGLWDDDTTTLRLVGDDSFAHSEAVAASDTNVRDETFATITIDQYGIANGIDRFGLIMLDIEGAELRALKGARHYLSQPPDRAPHVVFEVHRSFVDWSDGLENTEIVRYLRSFGYVTHAVRDFNSNVPMGNLPIELVPLDGAYLEGPPHGFNMVAVKDLSVVQGPLFRMCRAVSPKLLAHKDTALHHPLDGLPAALRRRTAGASRSAAA